MAKTLSTITKELALSTKEIATLKQALESSVQELSLTKAQLEERTRILSYLAQILLDVEQKIESSPSLATLPSKVSVWWILTNFSSVVDIVRFIIAKIKEFRTNIKINADQ
jgi:hypothetical protein